MTEDDLTRHDRVLLSLVLTLQYTTMHQLGKFTSPLTGKIERDLPAARSSIDLLEMLKVKCREGTPASVLSTLDTAVMELQMNYLDEVRKDQAAPPPPAGDDAGTADAGDDAGEGADA